MFTGYHRVSPGITGYHRVSLDPVILSGACGAPITRPGGRATLSCSPRPTIAANAISKNLCTDRDRCKLCQGLTNHLYKWLATVTRIQHKFLKSDRCNAELVTDRFLKTSQVKLVMLEACGALVTCREGRATLSCPPGSRLAIASSM